MAIESMNELMQAFYGSYMGASFILYEKAQQLDIVTTALVSTHITEDELRFVLAVTIHAGECFDYKIEDRATRKAILDMQQEKGYYSAIVVMHEAGIKAALHAFNSVQEILRSVKSEAENIHCDSSLH